MTRYPAARQPTGLGAWPAASLQPPAPGPGPVCLSVLAHTCR